MIWLVVVPLFLFWFYWVLRMLNYWKFLIIVGKMGSGKTTLLTKWAYQNSRKKVIWWNKDSKRKFWKFERHSLKIYSNCELVGIPYEPFNPLELSISKWTPEPFSVLFIDEISIFWSNRKFKSIDEDTLTFFKQLRKYHCRVYGFSQAFNVDKVMRDLCHGLYLCTPFLVTWSLVRRIVKYPDIKEDALNADSQLVDSIKFQSPLIWGAWSLTWIPHWIKYFDTFQKYSPTPDCENNHKELTTSTATAK